MPIVSTKSQVSIANNRVEKTFLVENNRLVPQSLLHKQSGSTFAYPAGSEAFLLRFKSAFGGESVKASALKIKSAEPVETPQTLQLRITFKPFKIKGCRISLTYAETLGTFDCAFRARLEFRCENDKTEKALLEFIDFAPVSLDGIQKIWTVPLPDKPTPEDNAFALGQPAFADSAFFGCEFPAADTNCENGFLFARRYYHRTMDVLTAADGVFLSDYGVSGIAAASTFDTVRGAFFSYLTQYTPAARPTRSVQPLVPAAAVLTKETAQTAFLEADKRLTAFGAPPAKQYLLPGTWQSFHEGNWCVPPSFPDGFFSPAYLAAAFGATLSLPFTPTGGAGKAAQKTAKLAQENSAAKYNKKARGFCTADAAYTESLQAFFMDCQSKYGVSGWQFDPVSVLPCGDKTHGHAVGGPRDVLYYTELTEQWINLCAALQKTDKPAQSLTLGGVLPMSPWLLQWVQTLRLCSDLPSPPKKFSDGRTMDGGKTQAFLTALDAQYYDRLQRRQLCLPLSAVTDPVLPWQVLQSFAASEEELFVALLLSAMRAPGLQTLQIDPEALNDAQGYLIAEAMRFSEEYAGLLKHTRMVGGDPIAGQVYGYAAFDGGTGLLLLRNPANEATDITFLLDETLGVSRQFVGAALTVLLPSGTQGASDSYTYGNPLSVSMPPLGVKLLAFGLRSKPVQCVTVRVCDDHTVALTMNQPVQTDAMRCDTHPLLSVDRKPDSRTFLVTIDGAWAAENTLTLSGLRDALGLDAAVTVRFRYLPQFLIRDGGLAGSGPFSIKATFGGEENIVLYLQGLDVKLSVESGFVYFKVGGTTLHSRRTVRDVVQVCAVREISGVLKLYLNGILDSGVCPQTQAYTIAPGTPVCFDEHRLRLYDRALAYDEV